MVLPIAFINKKSSGFTLIEVLVALAIMTSILAVGASANVNLFTREMSSSEQATLVSALQKARIRAMNNINATSHGVHIENGSDYYVLFKGSSYVSGASTNEKIWREKLVVINDGGPVSGGSGDIVFSQLSGNTTSTGTISLTDTVGRNKSVTISANGLISW